jgi:hypothetical protein
MRTQELVVEHFMETKKETSEIGGSGTDLWLQAVRT